LCTTGEIELMPGVLSGALDPGPVFDTAVPWPVPDGCRAMDDRLALKVRITFCARGPAARGVVPSVPLVPS
jgi:hypothetical protein